MTSKGTSIKMATFYGRSTFEEANALFTANNFPGDEDITAVIEALDDATWELVYNNRANYPARVWSMMERSDFIPKEKVKMRVVELTDIDMKKMEMDAQRKADEEETKKQNRTKLDELNDRLEELLMIKNRIYQKVQKHKQITKTARAPARYDPTLEKLFEEYDEINDRIDALEERISRLQDDDE